MKYAFSSILVIACTIACTANVPRADVTAGSSTAAHMISSSTASYSYAPTTLRDVDGSFKMWFCGNNSTGFGDSIYLTTAPAIDGPWSAPTEVFTALAGQFDSEDVCDPSVIRTPDGTYLLYFGAASHDSAASNGGQAWTSIGLAASVDGVQWSRVTDAAGRDKPIITPANLQDPSYGAGQPSVVLDATTGSYIMLYTDSTRGGDNLYAIRSADPTFATGVQDLQLGTGWVPETDPTNRPALQPGADADWAILGDQFVFAGNGGGALILSTVPMAGVGAIAAHPVGCSLVGDAALVHGPQGALVWDQQNVEVSCTVTDPSKSAAAPWDWSIQMKEAPWSPAGAP